MQIQLPEAVRWILNELQKHGQDAYAVGGCVRDTILGRSPQDWDITTSARPEQVKAIFKRTIDTGIQHGTVTVMVDHVGYEVTTYRIDGEYEDARHPKEVTFTSNLLEDLKRRDFTINAMAYNETTGLVDAFDGIGDLRRGIIRCVGNARERFGEDALRMLRAVRFAAQLGFTIEAETRTAIEELAGNLKKVSAERIQVELTKLLVSAHPDELRTLYQTGISAVILPEWDAMMETAQNHPHHCYSVGEHTIAALGEIRADKVLRYTMLLHDVAKPLCKTTDGKGIDHFYGHPQKGAELARKIMRRLKMDNATIDAVCGLIRVHDVNPKPERKAVRHAVYRAGLSDYKLLFEVKRADILAQSSYMQQEKLDYLRDYEQIYDAIVSERECISLKQLAIGGSDLIAAGMKPGPEIGRVLQKLLELVLDDPSMNTKEKLIGYTLKNLFI
ncbi:MAG: CCA tRNA nucleotidyltransferase [Lachnospiraceae bacterium]|nr:CCA tRNA nucleotidyltransferase [Lachnospiraceae bacterium]